MSMHLSLVRIARSEPIDWIVDYVVREFASTSRYWLIDNTTEIMVVLEGVRPSHPQIRGGFCTCTELGCQLCYGHGWVGWWVPLTDEIIRTAAAELTRVLHGQPVSG
jgi:hypothetical protein